MCLYWRKIFKEAILNSWTLNILYAVSVTDSLDVGEEKLNAFIFPCSNGAQGKLQNRCIQITEGLIKTVGNYAHYVKGGFSSEPRKEKHSVLKWKLFFFSPSIFVCRYVERFRWIQLRHWSSRTFQRKRRWLGWLLWLIYPWYFWNGLRRNAGRYQAVCLTVIYPLTIVLVDRAANCMHALLQKQIKLTALRMGKVCEELSNTPMLTLLQSLYLNDSPGS